MSISKITILQNKCNVHRLAACTLLLTLCLYNSPCILDIGMALEISVKGPCRRPTTARSRNDHRANIATVRNARRPKPSGPCRRTCTCTHHFFTHTCMPQQHSSPQIRFVCVSVVRARARVPRNFYFDRRLLDDGEHLIHELTSEYF